MDQQPEIPAYKPPVEQATPPAAAPSSNTQRVLALWLLIGPTALIIGSILLYAIVNFILGSVDGDSSVVRSVMNVILFLTGTISVIAWLPGIIAGIILLATQKKS